MCAGVFRSAVCAILYVYIHTHVYRYVYIYTCSRKSIDASINMKTHVDTNHLSLSHFTSLAMSHIKYHNRMFANVSNPHRPPQRNTQTRHTDVREHAYKTGRSTQVRHMNVPQPCDDCFNERRCVPHEPKVERAHDTCAIHGHRRAPSQVKVLYVRTLRAVQRYVPGQIRREHGRADRASRATERQPGSRCLVHQV